MLRPNRHRLADEGQLFNLHGYVVSHTGSQGTVSGDASERFTLFEVEEANPKDGKPRGFRLWIEPIPTSGPQESVTE